MAKQYDSISDKHAAFIIRQQIFFVATAAAEGRINLSPKGMDSLRISAPNQVFWLNLTGSGNETAAHLLENPRMTLMFCAFEGEPKILRLYGQARVYHQGSDGWDQHIRPVSPALHGQRRPDPLVMDVDLVQTSCGFACAASMTLSGSGMSSKVGRRRRARRGSATTGGSAMYSASMANPPGIIGGG